MRIPTSVVVMSILTAVPFGLAIHDSLRGPPVAEPATPTLEEQDAAFLTQQRHEQAELETREARRATQRALLRHLYVNDKQFLWGYRVDEPGITVHYQLDGTIQVELTDELMCDELARELHDEWGPGSIEGGDRLWLDPPGFAGQRVPLVEGDCKLDYDRYTRTDAMITTAADSIVPVAAIGSDARRFSARLAELETTVHPLQAASGNRIPDGDFVSWSAPGLGAGSGRTELKAMTRRGKIAQLFASGTASDTTLDELEASITASFGQSAPDAHDDRLRRWASSPPIALMRSPAGYTIVVGSER